MTEPVQKPAILLIVKSAHVAKSVSKLLATYFEVLVGDDSETAWGLLLERRDIAVVICELSLSIDRFGLLERIRDAGDTQLAATPILLLMGEGDADEVRETAFRLGATDFINLPFSTAELTTRVRLHANLFVQHAVEATMEMKQVSAVDLLRQLSQKTYFNSRVQQELSFSRRHKSNMTLCKLKLDNLKAIVAGFDKATAVSVVQAIAGIIQQTLRREDNLCYMGNAEFCILFSATNGIGATNCVNRILTNISERRVRIAGKQVPVTLSGVICSCIADEKTSVEQLHEQLEAGLRQAISSGGNQILNSASTAARQAYSIDRALKQIESKSVDGLDDRLYSLMQTLLPLLEFSEPKLGLGLDPVICKLREQHRQEDPE